MAGEQKIEQQFKEFEGLAKEHKDIDVAGLMINALENQNKNLVSGKWKKWAYLISIGLPPFGLLFALKFYFSDEDDAHHVANICIILTVISVAALYIIGKMVLNSSGTSLQQIQQIKPSDVQQLYQ